MGKVHTCRVVVQRTKDDDDVRLLSRPSSVIRAMEAISPLFHHNPARVFLLEDNFPSLSSAILNELIQSCLAVVVVLVVVFFVA